MCVKQRAWLSLNKQLRRTDEMKLKWLHTICDSDNHVYSPKSRIFKYREIEISDETAWKIKFDFKFEKVIAVEKFKKSTIAFQREVLNYYGIRNCLDRHLSAMSKYKHPKMEEIYEAARINGWIQKPESPDGRIYTNATCCKQGLLLLWAFRGWVLLTW